MRWIPEMVHLRIPDFYAVNVNLISAKVEIVFDAMHNINLHKPSVFITNLRFILFAKTRYLNIITSLGA